MLPFLLHTADISHASKPWDIHRRWTAQLAEAFYRQVDYIVFILLFMDYGTYHVGHVIPCQVQGGQARTARHYDGC
jgi:hypothetical protein